MLDVASGHRALDHETEVFYRHVLERMNESGLPYLLGGAYAFAGFTGIIRHTKDLDLFLSPADCPNALKIFEEKGYRTEMTDPIWLAKVFHKDAFVDLIFRSGNGVTEVDQSWFARAKEARVLDVQVKLCAPEDTIWSKAFIMERERYDGADVAHYLLVAAPKMDWSLLLQHFDKQWRVLLSHLILFGFIYPQHRALIPKKVMDELLGRLSGELGTDATGAEGDLCQGTLLSRVHYLVDTGPWGLKDARFAQRGTLTRNQLDNWREQATGEREQLLEKSGIFLDEVKSSPWNRTEKD
jgi:hypothetical protein